ncbi:MAG: hypothetical protein AAGC74_03330 [Verrucomicrobiota bacterium]
MKTLIAILLLAVFCLIPLLSVDSVVTGSLDEGSKQVEKPRILAPTKASELETGEEKDDFLTRIASKTWEEVASAKNKVPRLEKKPVLPEGIVRVDRD